MTTTRDGVRVRAYAKLNLTLRIGDVQPDGYHPLRSVFQAISLHDSVEVYRRPGPFRILSTDPHCPTDERNLVWKAAARLWAASGRRGQPTGLTVRLVKRVPMEAGLGGGSSDAAAALRACSVAWGLRASGGQLHEIASGLGADCAFFLQGGTALGLGRGDELFGLPDCTSSWVVVVRPPFGVSTRDAYGWLDADRAQAGQAPAGRRMPSGGGDAAALALGLQVPGGDVVNDLEAPVVARHPEVGRLVRALSRAGAVLAAMSGSGSAVFGVFRGRDEATWAAGALAGRGRLVLTARTLGRQRYATLSRVQPASGRGLPPIAPVV